MVSYLVKNVNLFDGIDVYPDPQSVLISDGQIQYVGENAPPNAPESAIVVDGSGLTLLPGLIDAHTHVFRGVEDVKRAIAAGVTTVFDMHNEPSNALFMKEQSQASSELPEIFSALHAATVDGGWPRAIVRHTNSDPTVRWPAELEANTEETRFWPLSRTTRSCLHPSPRLRTWRKTS